MRPASGTFRAAAMTSISAAATAVRRNRSPGGDRGEKEACLYEMFLPEHCMAKRAGYMLPCTYAEGVVVVCWSQENGRGRACSVRAERLKKVTPTNSVVRSLSRMCNVGHPEYLKQKQHRCSASSPPTP